jgi:hypothetical protein
MSIEYWRSGPLVLKKPSSLTSWRQMTSTASNYPVQGSGAFEFKIIDGDDPTQKRNILVIYDIPISNMTPNTPNEFLLMDIHAMTRTFGDVTRLNPPEWKGNPNPLVKAPRDNIFGYQYMFVHTGPLQQSASEARWYCVHVYCYFDKRTSTAFRIAFNAPIEDWTALKPQFDQIIQSLDYVKEDFTREPGDPVDKVDVKQLRPLTSGKGDNITGGSKPQQNNGSVIDEVPQEKPPLIKSYRPQRNDSIVIDEEVEEKGRVVIPEIDLNEGEIDDFGVKDYSEAEKPPVKKSNKGLLGEVLSRPRHSKNLGVVPTVHDIPR